VTELRQLIDQLARHPGVNQTGWPGLTVARKTKPMARTPVVYPACLCVVAQGTKHAYIGEQTFEYDSDHFLLCSLPLPIESEVQNASEEVPLLALMLEFDPAAIAKLLVEMDEFVSWPEVAAQPAVAPCRMTPGVRRAITRLLEVVASPIDRRILAPGLQREFLFEVLRGPNGNLLREFVLRDGSAHRVSRVVTHLEQNFRHEIDVSAIAKLAGMSSSTLYEHFKRATSLSPLQFVKKMRLHHARALLLSGRGASEAAFDVGYSSPSQFSREFRKMFGHSPNQVREAEVG
jgi:AraC-like DNA-binding protein